MKSEEKGLIATILEIPRIFASICLLKIKFHQEKQMANRADIRIAEITGHKEFIEKGRAEFRVSVDDVKGMLTGLDDKVLELKETIDELDAKKIEAFKTEQLTEENKRLKKDLINAYRALRELEDDFRKFLIQKASFTEISDVYKFLKLKGDETLAKVIKERMEKTSLDDSKLQVEDWEGDEWEREVLAILLLPAGYTTLDIAKTVETPESEVQEFITKLMAREEPITLSGGTYQVIIDDKDPIRTVHRLVTSMSLDGVPVSVGKEGGSVKEG